MKLFSLLSDKDLINMTQLSFKTIVNRTRIMIKQTTGALGSNVYLVSSTSPSVNHGKTAVFDPGIIDTPERVTKLVDGQDVALIMLTHGHIDHHNAAKAVQDITGAPILMHTDEFKTRSRSLRSLSELQGCDVRPVVAGQAIRMADLKFNVLHTPGHTLGSVCYYEEFEGIIFSGDVLLELGGEIVAGPTCFEESNGVAMALSLASIITLPPKTFVLPGHGQPFLLQQVSQRIYEMIGRFFSRRQINNRTVFSVSKEGSLPRYLVGFPRCDWVFVLPEGCNPFGLPLFGGHYIVDTLVVERAL